MNIEINDYEILDRANRFKDAAETLKASDNLIPTELNACLACELYLKYLVNFVNGGIHTIMKSQIEKEHSLEELYGMCDDSIKNQIKEKMGDDFKTSLEKVKLNFIEIRYDYECEKITYSPMFVLEFMEVLSEICCYRQNHQM